MKFLSRSRELLQELLLSKHTGLQYEGNIQILLIFEVGHQNKLQHIYKSSVISEYSFIVLLTNIKVQWHITVTQTEF
jgi:hypothetical protein